MHCVASSLLIPLHPQIEDQYDPFLLPLLLLVLSLFLVLQSPRLKVFNPLARLSSCRCGSCWVYLRVCHRRDICASLRVAPRTMVDSSGMRILVRLEGEAMCHRYRRYRGSRQPHPPTKTNTTSGHTYMCVKITDSRRLCQPTATAFFFSIFCELFPSCT